MFGSAFSRNTAMTARQGSQDSVIGFMLGIHLAIVASVSTLAPLRFRRLAAGLPIPSLYCRQGFEHRGGSVGVQVLPGGQSFGPLQRRLNVFAWLQVARLPRRAPQTQSPPFAHCVCSEHAHASWIQAPLTHATLQAPQWAASVARCGIFLRSACGTSSDIPKRQPRPFQWRQGRASPCDACGSRSATEPGHQSGQHPWVASFPTGRAVAVVDWGQLGASVHRFAPGIAHWLHGSTGSGIGVFQLELHTALT
jgi:hypothetical protein